MPPRRDYSQIARPGSHAAKRCPVRVQLDELQPGEPVPMAPDLRLRLEQGDEFESAIVSRLHSVAGAG